MSEQLSVGECIASVLVLCAALTLFGCSSGVEVPAFGTAGPVPAQPSSTPAIHDSFIGDMCAALDAGDAAEAGRLTSEHNKVHPGAFPEALNGMAARCPHQVERLRRSMEGEPSSGESQLEYLCTTDPSAPECTRRGGG